MSSKGRKGDGLKGSCRVLAGAMEYAVKLDSEDGTGTCCTIISSRISDALGRNRGSGAQDRSMSDHIASVKPTSAAVESSGRSGRLQFTILYQFIKQTLIGRTKWDPSRKYLQLYKSSHG